MVLERKTLKFFASPLHEAGGETSHNHGHPHGHATYEKAPTVEETVTASGSDVVSTGSGNNVVVGKHDECLHDSPAFRRHAEATNIELFFDLFFVANLTTFTNVHEVNDHHALASYVGFFSVLWFTWYQVSLYDVRFSNDSVFERIFKALHFGVMVGFAVTGPQYVTDSEGYWVGTFRALSLILMVSRLVLCAQYSIVYWAIKHHTKTRLPLLLIIGSNLLAAVLYGAITPAFPRTLEPGEKSHTYIAFYVIAVFETAFTTAVSCSMRVISFKGTHFVQRMSLLTLIILGEGVIGLTKSISSIVKNYYQFSAGVVGQIISAVLIIYFLYMLYFDRLEDSHFGTIRQQLWAFAHFPLHIAFVLLLEGDSQMILWRQGIQSFQSLSNALVDITQQFIDSKAKDKVTDFISTLNATAWDAVFDYVPAGVDATESINQVNEALTKLSETLETSGLSEEKMGETITDEVSNVLYALMNTVLESLGIEAPESKSENAKTPEAALDALTSVLELVYIYLFVAAGLTLIIMAFISYISRPPKTLSAWIRLGAHIALGLGLSLLALMDLTDAAGEYVITAWVLPTLCLVLFTAVLAMHVSLPKSLRRRT